MRKLEYSEEKASNLSWQRIYRVHFTISDVNLSPKSQMILKVVVLYLLEVSSSFQFQLSLSLKILYFILGLFNMRGIDVEYNPFFMAYAILETQSGALKIRYVTNVIIFDHDLIWSWYIYISLRNYNYNLTQTVHARSLDGSIQSNFHSDQISKMAATPSTFFFTLGLYGKINKYFKPGIIYIN